MSYKFEYSFTMYECIDVTCEVEYDAVYQPAKVSGPPENCYPDESQLDIWDVKPITVENEHDCGIPSNTEILNYIMSIRSDQLQQACWDDFHAQRESYYEDREYDFA